MDRTGGARRGRRSGLGLKGLVVGTVGVVGIVGIVVAALLAQATPAGAQEPSSKIRLGHFSPDTPEMDVYLVGLDGEESRVLQGLGYGEVSDYAPLDPGEYTFLLRPAGSPADSDPAVTATATLEEGSAYTFAAMGPSADLQQALVTDDLAPPPAGQAKVRLIQASSTAGTVDVRAVDGPVLAEGAEFASTTDYAPVDSGSWTVEVTATGDGGPVTRTLDLDAGTVSSLVVLEGTDGQPFELTRVVDATGVDASSSGGELGITQATPLGGVATGGGGMADSIAGGSRGGDGGSPWTSPLTLSLAAALAAGVALGGTRLVRAHAGGPPPDAPTRLRGRRSAGKHFAAAKAADTDASPAAASPAADRATPPPDRRSA